MSDKIFLKYFSKDFTGINAECSAIEPEGDEVSRAVNLEWALSNNLRGRTGTQLASAPSEFDFIYSHTYSRTTPKYVPKFQTGGAWSPGIASTAYVADGSIVKELLAFNDDLWVLDNLSIPITITGGPKTGYYYLQSNPGISSIEFVVYNGTSTSTIVVNNGLETRDGGYRSIWYLLTQLDADFNYSYPAAGGGAPTRDTAPPFATVNGNQPAIASGALIPGHGYPYIIPVRAGHTFNVGDPICFFNHYLPASQPLVAGIVTAIAAGPDTVTAVLQSNGVISLKDWQVLGYLCQPAAAIPITTKTIFTAVNTFNLIVPYWRNISWNSQKQAYDSHHYIRNSSQYMFEYSQPRTAISASGCCYFANRLNSPSSTNQQPLQKYDGQCCSNAGSVAPTLAVAVGGAGALTGAYKYKLMYKRIDAQGNIFESTPGPEKTYTAAATAILVTMTQKNNGNQLICLNGGMLSAHVAAASTHWHIDNGAGGLSTLKLGDPVAYIDDTIMTAAFWASGAATITATPALHRDWIIGVKDGLEYLLSDMSQSVEDNAPVSSGTTLVVLRTTAGGNFYYYHSEWPNNPWLTTWAFNDNISDAVLIANAKYIPAAIGKEHDPAPYCTLVTQHQGGLVVAGDCQSPNTISYSTVDGIEYFPIASNSLDIPSTIEGPITAIASDTQDRLAVFKRNAYYDISGDLDSGAMSVQVITEGDFGIPCQNSIQRIKSLGLVGLSNLGFIIISNGVLYDQPLRTINARIINQNWRIDRAVSAIDAYNRNYICVIPKTYDAVSGSSVFSIDFSREKLVPLERAYPEYAIPWYSIAYHNNTLYTSCYGAFSQFGVYRSLERFSSNSPTGYDGDSYIDHIWPISYILETQPINFGEPSVLKTPIRLRTFSIPNEGIIEGWVPWSCVVTTTIFPDTTYLGSGYPGGTTSTINFTDTKGYFKDIKLRQSKCLLYIIRFTTNVIRQSPFFTGYEILFSDSYKKEDLAK